MKTILSIALLCASTLFATAQTKPVYTPDPNKTITFTVTLKLGQLNDYILVESNGGPDKVKTSPQVTGAQLYGADGKSGIIGNHQATVDTLNYHLGKAFNDYIVADKARFTADTLKRYHNEKINK